MKKRTLPIGAAVRVRGAAGERHPGSIGAFAANEEGVWLISANHVLAGNGRYLPTADPQHGVYVGDERVGRTVVFAHLQRRGNLADAAGCRVEATAGFRPKWPAGWSPSAVPHRPRLKTRVRISVDGCDRWGVVRRVGAFRVSMDDFPGMLGDVEFLNSFLVEAIDAEFARPGNSGGLVVTADNECQPVGLVVGTSVEAGSNFVVITPIGQVLAALGLPNRIFV